jgi:hypothetical protein
VLKKRVRKYTWDSGPNIDMKDKRVVAWNEENLWIREKEAKQ